MFGVYVHIPYCLQKCVYCDFATVETSSPISQSVPPIAYIERVKKEIRAKAKTIGPRPLDTLYFGGGTPSLLSPELLIVIVEELKQNGFALKRDGELTLEINPGTLNGQDFDQLRAAGFNRYSVGVQSFDDSLLRQAHRKHSSQDSRATLCLLNERKLNFSLDILFAQPNQTKEGLKQDLDEALRFSPLHVSPYCLTVPQGHPFSKNRAPEEEQADMFSMIEESLNAAGLERYEVSNFARPGFESQHNQLYWDDSEYWGIGLSSHSYIRKNFEFGCRFWNPQTMQDYVEHVDKLQTESWRIQHFALTNGEILKEHQALTDFFHTSLRRKKGFTQKQFEDKFSKPLETTAGGQLERLVARGLIAQNEQNYRLSALGIVLADQVFLELTYLSPKASPHIDKAPGEIILIR